MVSVSGKCKMLFGMPSYRPRPKGLQKGTSVYKGVGQGSN